MVCIHEKQSYQSFPFEEPMLSDVTFLAMMENTLSCYVPVGTVFSYMVHHLTSPIVFIPLWTRSFLIVG